MGSECGEHERGAGAEIGCVDNRTLKSFNAGDECCAGMMGNVCAEFEEFWNVLEAFWEDAV